MGWLTTTMSEEQEDRTPYPIKAVIAYRKAKWLGHYPSTLNTWCEMAAVPVSAAPLAEPYKRWRLYRDDPLPDDPLLKLAVLVVQMRASEQRQKPKEKYWYDALKSAEEAEKRGFIEIPLVSETCEAWEARKSEEWKREATL